MAGPQGHHYDDHRMGRWGSDNHGWRMSDGGARSNGNKWNPEHGCVPMCTSMTCTVRSFASGANSWDSFGGRFELNGAAAAKQYTSRIRLSQCHKAFNCMTCSNRSFACGVQSWSMLRGRYELNLVPMAVKEYTSCIRMPRCHKALIQWLH